MPLQQRDPPLYYRRNIIKETELTIYNSDQENQQSQYSDTKQKSAYFFSLALLDPVFSSPAILFLDLSLQKLGELKLTWYPFNGNSKIDPFPISVSGSTTHAFRGGYIPCIKAVALPETCSSFVLRIASWLLSISPVLIPEIGAGPVMFEPLDGKLM